MNSITSLKTTKFQGLSVKVTDGTTTLNRVNTESLEKVVMFPMSDWPVKVFYESFHFKRTQKNPEEHLNNGQVYYLS